MAITTPETESGTRPSSQAQTAPNIIEVHGLTKRYKQHEAVRGIDLDVRAGEIFGILGPNGAGKTTTLEMIEGLRKPDAGTITVAGIDAIADSDRVREVIGVQLQSTALFPHLNARELIELFANLYSLPAKPDRASHLLKLVGLEDKAAARVDQLSGGQKQRLSIALALVNEPKVTFLDEPTTGLDPHARRKLWETILGVRQAGTTVVLTTHYMEEAEVLCDRIAVMDGGRVIACDTPAGLIRALDLEAVVSATIPNDPADALPESALLTIPGVTTATVSALETPPKITLQTRDTQATIVGLLDLAAKTRITLGELNSTRASLEDVFLNLTGRSYANEEASSNSDDTGTAGPEPANDPDAKPKRRGWRR